VLDLVHEPVVERIVVHRGQMGHEEDRDERQRADDGPRLPPRRAHAATGRRGVDPARVDQGLERAGDDEQRRGDGDEQDVLDHVPGEAALGGALEPRRRGQHDRADAADPRGQPPTGRLPLAHPRRAVHPDRGSGADADGEVVDPGVAEKCRVH
jgi:hypothetical protein